MRRSHERHPLFENLVFGMALVLLAVLLFYGARAGFRWYGARAAEGRPPAADAAPVANPGPDVQGNLEVGPVEHGVNQLPPVKISRPAKVSHKTAAVPTPQ